MGQMMPSPPLRPKWAREYLHHADTFVGAQEVQERFFGSEPCFNQAGGAVESREIAAGEADGQRGAGRA